MLRRAATPVRATCGKGRSTRFSPHPSTNKMNEQEPKEQELKSAAAAAAGAAQATMTPTINSSRHADLFRTFPPPPLINSVAPFPTGPLPPPTQPTIRASTYDAPSYNSSIPMLTFPVAPPPSSSAFFGHSSLFYKSTISTGGFTLITSTWLYLEAIYSGIYTFY